MAHARGVSNLLSLRYRVVVGVDRQLDSDYGVRILVVGLPLHLLFGPRRSRCCANSLSSPESTRGSIVRWASGAMCRPCLRWRRCSASAGGCGRFNFWQGDAVPLLVQLVFLTVIWIPGLLRRRIVNLGLNWCGLLIGLSLAALLKLNYMGLSLAWSDSGLGVEQWKHLIQPIEFAPWVIFCTDDEQPRLDANQSTRASSSQAGGHGGGGSQQVSSLCVRS